MNGETWPHFHKGKWRGAAYISPLHGPSHLRSEVVDFLVAHATINDRQVTFLGIDSCSISSNKAIDRCHSDRLEEALMTQLKEKTSDWSWQRWKALTKNPREMPKRSSNKKKNLPKCPSSTRLSGYRFIDYDSMTSSWDYVFEYLTPVEQNQLRSFPFICENKQIQLVGVIGFSWSKKGGLDRLQQKNPR